MLTDNESRRKSTGGRTTRNQKKKKHNTRRETLDTRLGDDRRAREARVRGGNSKRRLVTVRTANVIDPEDNEAQKAEIQDVVENPSNPQLVRRNIITKGAVIETEIGKARVTSRPGQEGTINAVLTED